MKRRAFFRIISYIGAVLLATAVILLLLAIIKVPVEKPADQPNERNQTETSQDPGQNETGQVDPGNSGGVTPSRPSSSGVSSGSPTGPNTSRAPAQSTNGDPAPSQGPAPTSPPPEEEPDSSILDTLIDGVQNVLPEGGLL